MLAFKKTNPNTQEVKYERFLIETRLNNVHIFGIYIIAFNKATDGQTDLKEENDET